MNPLISARSGNWRHRHFCLLIVIVLITAYLVGCTLVPSDIPENSTAKQYDAVDLHSAYPTVSRQNIEQINLVELIDPEGKAAEKYPKEWEAATKGKEEGKEWARSFGPRYDLSLDWFRHTHELSDEEKRLDRNSLQERMLAASMSRCNVFKTFLQRDQSDVNFWLGSATTVSGVLGAVVPGVTASRNLAGAAGIFSGVNAEHNQAYFSNLASNVLVKGIETRQAAVQTTLRTHGQKESIRDYPMEAAIRDAIYFDGLCSTVVGLEEAADAIRTVNNPGLRQGMRAIISVSAMRDVANTKDFAELQASGRLTKLEALVNAGPSLLAAAPPVTAAKGAATTPESLLDSFSHVKPAIQAYITTQAIALESKYNKTYNDLFDKLAAENPDESLKEKDTIKTPLAMRKEFEAQMATQFLGKLNLSGCNATVKRMSKELAEAKIELTLATSEPDRIIKRTGVDKATNAVTLEIERLQSIIDLAKMDVDTTVAASEGWKAAKEFNGLLHVTDETWVKIPEKKNSNIQSENLCV